MKLQLNITQEQKDKLAYLAQSEGRSITSYVLWHLGLTQNPPPFTQGIPTAKQASPTANSVPQEPHA